MVSAHLSRLPHPKPLGTKIRACLAAGAVLVTEKTCDLVILALKPFFLDAVNLRHSYAFLAQPCAFNAFYAASCL